MNRTNRSRSGLRRFGLLIPVFLVAALVAPMNAWAGVEDNIRADSLSVELSGNQLIATLTYSVTDVPFPGLGNVNPYTIEVGIDRNGDEIIDELLASFPGETSGTEIPGAHQVSQDIRAQLDALAAADRIQDGDRLIANLDVNNDNPNEFLGTGEDDNFVAATPFYVDMIAESLTLDPDNWAHFAYMISAPAKIRGTSVEFWLDVDNSGNVSGGDLLVASDTAKRNPGIHTISADFNGSVPATGQNIIAILDADNDLVEAKNGNNDAVYANLAQTDLEAISLTYDEGMQEATFNYYVKAPADVAAYPIDFFLDMDASGSLTAGDSLITSVAGDVTVGSHSLMVDCSGNPAASDQFVIAFIDRPGLNPPNGNVVESVEIANNWAVTANTFANDIEAISLTYDSNTGMATFVYQVLSPTVVDPFTVRFMLDRDNSGGPGGDAPPVNLIAGETMPGVHVVTQFYGVGDAPASNQKIYAIVDANAQITEDDETNNRADATNFAQTDLVAISLSYDPNTQDAVLSYSVEAPIDVPAYNIEFAVDTDNSGTPSAGDFILPVQPGNTTPGSYSLTVNFGANAPAAEQFIFAWIDRLPAPNGAVDETDDVGNNQAAAQNTDILDLEAVALAFNPATGDATFTYVVNSPINVGAYKIDFLLDDGDGVLTGADTTVQVVDPGEAVPGAYFLTVSFAGNPPASGGKIFARLDRDGAVDENDETNNVAEAINDAPTDLVANAIGSLVYDPELGVAVFNYEVDSTADVAPFNIAFVLDNGDYGLGLGDQLIGLPVAGDTSPGLHSLIFPIPAAFQPDSLQAIFALIDLPAPGNVAETEEIANNWAITINTELTDLEVLSMSYDANTQVATLNYVVFAPNAVDGNVIQWYLETNGTPGLQTGVGGDQVVFVDVLGETAPGAHTAQFMYNAWPIASGQALYATIDTTDVVTETNEGNNLGSTINTTPTDLVAVSLAYDSNLTEAELTYLVDAPINVAPFKIRFFLDTNNSGIVDPGDNLVAELNGDVAPGGHTLTADFSAFVPGSGQFIFGVVDTPLGTGGTVAELDDVGNNTASTSNTQSTDLIANYVEVVVDPVTSATMARVAYTVSSPVPVPSFSLKLGIDRGHPLPPNDVIDGGPFDLLVNDMMTGVMLEPGFHVYEIPDFQAALNALAVGTKFADGDQIVATLDLDQDGGMSGSAVTEAIEQLNNTVVTAPIVDIVANSLTILTDVSANSTKARVAYTINAPGQVEEFTILVGMDRNDNGVIDDPADVLTTINVTGNKTKPGPRTITSDDFRAAINAIDPKLQQGDFILAVIDLDDANTPINDVIERDEVANNKAKQKQKIDLMAHSISVVTDVDAGTTEADVAYTVNSPGSTEDFSLKVGLDRDGDGKIDDPDGLLADLLLTGADVEPGAHTITVTGLRAALNGLATPIKNGDAIVATLDLKLDGTKENAVVEDVEVNNNSVAQIQTVDLVANSIALQSDVEAGTTSATVSYLVVSPADVAAFDIRLGVDRNGDDIIDADASDLLLTIAAPDLTPGTHTATVADIRAELEALVDRLANEDRVIATLDLLQDGTAANNVGEAEEILNNVTGQEQTVDLVAVEINLFTTPPELRKARVSYTVNSVGSVASFTMHIGLDLDNDGIMDLNSPIRTYDVEADFGIDAVRPGEHKLVSDDLAAILDTLELENGDRIIATLDLDDDGAHTPLAAVKESEDVANNKTRQPLAVDLIAISLAYDSNTDWAELSYFVSSMGGVPDYKIRFYLDDNPRNDAWDPTDTPVHEVDGAVLPGEHVALGDFTTTQVNSLQYIFAVIDEVDAVDESDETNNIAGTDNTEITDLVANLVRVDSDDTAFPPTTTVTVAYTIVGPDPVSVNPFNILIGVDRDGDNVIDADLEALLATIPAPFLTAGSHEVTSGNLRAELAGLTDRLDDGDRIIATLDLTRDGLAVNDVEEIGGDETGNNVASDEVSVDLIATALEVFKIPATGEIVGRVNYTVNSVGAVNTFNIRVGVDADNNNIIDNPDGLLATIDPATINPFLLSPGDQNVMTLDLTAYLNTLPTPLKNADRLIATIDTGYGTAENLVVESVEWPNNFARAPLTVDLVASSLALDVNYSAGTTSAAVTYNVESFGYTADFSLRIGIDRDGDNIIDSNVGDELFNTILSGADVLPGSHTFEVADIRTALNALNPPIEYGDRIIATLDLDLTGADEAAVKEANEVGNNVTSTSASTVNIDIIADSLEINVGSFNVTANYSVYSPGNIAPFDVVIGWDTDADDIIDIVLKTEAGNNTPGAHSINADVAAELLAQGVSSGATVDIVVDFDSTAAVAEFDEANNKLTGSGIYAVDLLCPKLTHPCAVLDNPFDVEIHYSVLYNEPVEDFDICVYASMDDSPSVSVGDIMLDCVTINAAADKAVGDHTVTISGVQVSSGDFVNAHQFKIKAVLDQGAAVVETKPDGTTMEDNNVLSRPNASQDPSEDPDGDGVPNCFDLCPADPNKTEPGTCGCGVPDTDTDGDGVPDCVDNCPNDPNKLDPGACGCGVVEDLTDADLDGVFACLDPDDNDPDVPNPQGAPGGQETPGTGTGGGLQIIWPLSPALPYPVCGIGLCGTGSMVPLGIMMLGFIGLRSMNRRRRF